MSSNVSLTIRDSLKERLLRLARSHNCWSHPLFDTLASGPVLTNERICRLLHNYDAHASVLRRLLLQAAAAMPEPAVGYILENVRNEYGNGDYSRNHQHQLQDLAWQAGVQPNDYFAVSIEEPVRLFCKTVPQYYAPRTPSESIGFDGCKKDQSYLNAAIAAGAITATEVLAIREFQFLQQAFFKLNLGHHIWFHHVSIEEEHSDESLDLALYFIEHHRAVAAVELGMKGVLDANCHLYDGLLAAIR